MPKYLRLYGDIGEGDCSAAAFTAELAKVPAMTAIVVAINSPWRELFRRRCNLQCAEEA